MKPISRKTEPGTRAGGNSQFHGRVRLCDDVLRMRGFGWTRFHQNVRAFLTLSLLLTLSAFVCVCPRLSVVPGTTYKKEESNGRASNFPAVSSSTFPLRLARTTGTSPQNSQMIWRQAPQGGVKRSTSVTTAIASNPRSPSDTALKIATRSAQQVRPSVAFSTLHPVWMRPDFARTAAPTRKFEKGA